MDKAAFASPISVIFAIKPGAGHVGLPLCAAGGNKGWEDADTVRSCLRKGRGWESEPGPAVGSERTFPTHTLSSVPAITGGSDFDLSTRMLICLAFPLENLDFRR